MIKYSTYANGSMSVGTAGQYATLSGAEHAVAMSVDSFAYQGVKMAAAKGVPWAAIVVLVKEILIAVVGAVWGADSKCVTDKLTGPTMLTLVTKAVILDYGNALFCTSGTPGEDVWDALKLPLQACGFSPSAMAAAEKAVYHYFVGQSLCKSTNNKIRAAEKKAKTRYDKLKADEKLAKEKALQQEWQKKNDEKYGGGGDGGSTKKQDNTMLYVAIGAIVLFAVGKGKK